MIINQVSRPTDKYIPSVAFQFECDSGSSSWRSISSLEEFRLYYTNTRADSNYLMAQYLLNVGYRIVVRNKNPIKNQKSLRLFSNGKYTHFDSDFDYSYDVDSEKDLSLSDLLSFDLRLTQDILDQDYLLVSNGASNILIWFNESYDPNNPTLPTNITTDEFNIFKLITDPRDRYRSLLNVLDSLGFVIREIIENELIRVYNFLDTQIINKSSDTFILDYTKKNGTYDSLGIYYDNLKVIDFISRSDSRVTNIELELRYDGIFYTLIVKKFSDISSTIESYRNRSIVGILDDVSLNSDLIDTQYYEDTLETIDPRTLIGTYRLEREIEEYTEYTIDPPNYIELMEDYYPDIYLDLDSQRIPEVFDSPNVITFTKNRQYLSYRSIVYFRDNDVILTETNTHINIFFIYLFKYYSDYNFQGIISDIEFLLNSYDNIDSKEDENLNQIRFDNRQYYIDNCKFKDDELSVKIVPILLRNYLERECSFDIDQESFELILNRFVISFSDQLVVGTTDLSLKKNNNKLTIVFKLELSYQSITYFEDIIVNIE